MERNTIRTGRERGVCRERNGGVSSEGGEEREDVGVWERQSVLIIKRQKDICRARLG